MATTYRQREPVEKRKAEYERLVAKYPDRIPIICEKMKTRGNRCDELRNVQYLVPTDLTVGNFMAIIRKRIKLSDTEAMFLFVDGNIISCSSLISDVYEKYRDKTDKLLYFQYCSENTFG
jgi:GABA(A) receptor-associated protein